MLAQVMHTFPKDNTAVELTSLRRPSQSMVRNGTKCKKLCRSEGITKSDNDG